MEGEIKMESHCMVCKGHGVIDMIKSSCPFCNETVKLCDDDYVWYYLIYRNAKCNPCSCCNEIQSYEVNRP